MIFFVPKLELGFFYEFFFLVWNHPKWKLTFEENCNRSGVPRHLKCLSGYSKWIYIKVLVGASESGYLFKLLIPYNMLWWFSMYREFKFNFFFLFSFFFFRIQKINICSFWRSFLVRSDYKNLHRLSERLASPGITGAHLRDLL